jgi:hypothetical protein
VVAALEADHHIAAGAGPGGPDQHHDGFRTRVKHVMRDIGLG